MPKTNPNLKKLILAVAILFVLLDVGIWLVSNQTQMLRQAVDIQTPQTLFAKLNYLRGTPGNRIVFLGDSVVFGDRMKSAGDAEWRQHTISTHVETALKSRFPTNQISTLNLAINGGLSADFEQMIRLVHSAKPNCLVIDVSLRSFSADFAAPESQFSRPWLKTTSIDDAFYLRTKTGKQDYYKTIEATLRDFATNYWQLFRLRDFVQWRLFDGEPATLITRLRTWANNGFAGDESQEADPLDEILLILKAKNRYSSITLTSENPQVAALQRSLEFLAENNQCAIFFYATEEKTQLASLIESERYELLQSQLAGIFATYQSRGIGYIPPINNIDSKHYIDYGHLKSAGNALVAEKIVTAELARRIDAAKN